MKVYRYLLAATFLLLMGTIGAVVVDELFPGAGIIYAIGLGIGCVLYIRHRERKNEKTKPRSE